MAFSRTLAWGTPAALTPRGDTVPTLRASNRVSPGSRAAVTALPRRQPRWGSGWRPERGGWRPQAYRHRPCGRCRAPVRCSAPKHGDERAAERRSREADGHGLQPRELLFPSRLGRSDRSHVDGPPLARGGPPLVSDCVIQPGRARTRVTRQFRPPRFRLGLRVKARQAAARSDVDASISSSAAAAGADTTRVGTCRGASAGPAPPCCAGPSSCSPSAARRVPAQVSMVRWIAKEPAERAEVSDCGPGAVTPRAAARSDN